ncbi:histone-lysine N-methyltransferase ATXR4 [Nymphaea colorata]|nr:histone-lysine N-methyltransferase ATXR4 [Nymphaea colorata]
MGPLVLQLVNNLNIAELGKLPLSHSWPGGFSISSPRRSWIKYCISGIIVPASQPKSCLPFLALASVLQSSAGTPELHSLREREREREDEMMRVCRSKRLCLSMVTRREFTSVSEECPSAAAARPPPIRVSMTEHAGRGVFATRRINSGDLIHTAQPLVTHPALSLIDKVCYLCLKRLKLGPKQKEMPDGDTLFFSSEHRLHQHNLNNGLHVSFCSEKCYNCSKGFFDVEKKADWSSFHDHCSMKGLKYPFLVKRLSCMVLSGAAPADSLDILQPAVLPSNLISELNVEFQLLRSILVRSGVTDEQLFFLTREWYINVLSRIRINSFRVELVGGISEDLLASAVASISAEASVGNAVYMIPSFYNHDCDPNAHIIWIDSSHARMKALSNIEPGEEIRICYIDASMDHEARQVLLYNGFGFKCKCLRCLSGD